MGNDATPSTADQPRDEAGRFTSQTATADGAEEVAEESATPPAEDESEATSEAAEAATPTGEPARATTEAAPPEDTSEGTPTAEEPTARAESQPFSFRADGKEIAIDGATLTGESITIPVDAWQRIVQPNLADRRVWERERNRLQTEVRNRDPERNESVVKAQHLLTKLETIATELERGNEAPLVDLVNNFTSRFQVWKTEAENEALKRAVRGHTESSEAERRQQEAVELDPQLRAALRQNVDSVLASEPFKGLGFRTDEVAAEMWDLFERGTPVFLDLRDPQAAQARGVAPDVYVDVGLVQQYLDRPAKVMREREAAAKKKAAAEKANKAVLEPRRPPPVVTGAGSPEVGGKGRPEKFKDKDEYEAYLRRTYGPV